MFFPFVQDMLLWPLAATAFFGGYLSGSVPYGLILTRLFGMGDIRKIGSGNIGATNVLRTGNKKLAAATLLLDGLKGTVPVLVAREYHMDYALLAALGAFLGHLFPIWLKFKGGKGVATALGLSFGFSWVLGGALCGIWLLSAFVSKYSSLSALIAFAAAPIVAFLLLQNLSVAFILATVSLMVWAKHHENIYRLMQGTESKINLKKTSS